MLKENLINSRVLNNRAALAACGWAGVFDLSTVTAECENSGEFERSAALALWYGDIGGAVDALQRGADETTQTGSSSTAMYHETLELVSLSLAGYRGGGDSSRSFSSVWRKACEKLLLRPNLSDPVLMPSGARYLRHILQFLITIGIDDRHEAVMSDAMLSICDRVAFGCRFLPRTDLASFLDQCVQHCKDTGNVEGIAVTGLDKQGILILQSFVDSTSDVQTAALVTSRVIFPPDWTTERRVHAEWLSAYRSLLNRWQMWQSRAMFDVDRADLLRKVKMRLMASTSNITNNNSNIINDGAHGNINGKPLGRRVMTAGGRRAGGARGGVDLDVQVAVPAQLDARCNYCSAPLALRRRPDSQQPDQWLSKMKSVLPCCPQCRKALPRCAICMLSLGVLNPYMELAKERPRIGPRTSVTGGPSPMPAGVSYLHQQLQQHPDDLSSVSNLPFAEWFSWCLRCKHGGHAHHMVGWFAKHDVCPVSGCNCPCQFDEIHTLPRPFLP